MTGLAFWALQGIEKWVMAALGKGMGAPWVPGTEQDSLPGPYRVAVTHSFHPYDLV